MGFSCEFMVDQWEFNGICYSQQFVLTYKREILQGFLMVYNTDNMRCMDICSLSWGIQQQKT